MQKQVEKSENCGVQLQQRVEPACGLEAALEHGRLQEGFGVGAPAVPVCVSKCRELKEQKLRSGWKDTEKGMAC